MRSIVLLLPLLVLLPAAGVPPNPNDDFEALKSRAEASYAEKSFGRAHDLYVEAAKAARTDEEKRWSAVRLADTAWRAGSDAAARDAARETLEELLRNSAELHDRAWAEAQESLGDLLFDAPYGVDPAAISHYREALDWWAGSPDLSLARRRYLDIVYRAITPHRNYATEYGPENVAMLPREVLANAMAIAETPEDRAHTQFLFGRKLLEEGAAASTERALELLGKVIERGPATRWYQHALMAAADQYVRGVPVTSDEGEVSVKPDYERALALYNRLLRDFTREQTRYYDRARKAAEEITSPQVTVMVSTTFLPGSEQEVGLAWRNVKEVALTITPVDLIDDAERVNGGGVPRMTDFRTTREPVRRWSWTTNDTGDHTPGQTTLRVSPKLEPGAYVIDAAAGTVKSRQRLLVSDANIVVNRLASRADIFVCSAVTGEPIPGARIRIWADRQDLPARVYDLTGDANGLATATFDRDSGGTLVVAATAGAPRQATVSTWWWYGSGSRGAAWRVYAFTDRPAYRPDETVHWKIIARARPESDWVTPAGETLNYEIVAPRGGKIAEGTAKLNEFGSFWADLPLTSSMPLGEYRIAFRRQNADNESAGSATLFRLEEYKLPEFRVGVTAGDQGGAKKIYRSGDTVEAVIDASYYFGGPVAKATVNVEYSARPFNRFWYPSRRYDWYYDTPNIHGGGSRETRTQTLTTDANGRAVLRIETSPDDYDTEYSIVARVTDASRREVAGRGTVRVARQAYEVFAHPAHYLHGPGEKVTVEFKALDANDGPVRTTGTVKVIRRVWNETWIDPAGREIGDREIARIRTASGSRVPPPWRIRESGYREEEVTTLTASTSAEGVAEVSFVPSRVGYYTLKWTSVDRGAAAKVRARDVISAETSVWVSDRAVSEIGYHTAGIEIIADRESFRSGSTAPVMIATPASGQWVLLTTSAGRILDTQLLHLDGTVKLVQLPLDDRHTPSFFINTASVRDMQLSSASLRVVVPPVAHFIDVRVKANRDEYRPRDEGSLTVTTRDVDGKPVPAEVALSLSDESVTAIQSDPAGDPRQFFFERNAISALMPVASVQQQRYLRLVEERGKLIDERFAGASTASDNRPEGYGALAAAVGGVVGGVAGGIADRVEGGREAALLVPPPAAPMPMREAKASAPQLAGEAASIDVVVRSDFRSTAFWQPDVLTGPDGTATVKVRLPESLTTWRATARAVSAGSSVGMGTTTTRTSMPMLVRLEAPRFFVAGDRATISAVVNNNTDSPLRVRAAANVEGITLSGAEHPLLEVPPHGESRADWTVVAERAGPAKIRVTGIAEGGESLTDAMEKPFTVWEHGIDKLVARSGKVRGEEAVIRLDLPPARRGTSLTVQLQPSLATAMLDALPYLIRYPYGCTEQTMSRFLPAAIVSRTLAKNGIAAADIEGRIFGGIEPGSAAATHPDKSAGLGKLDEVIAASKARLVDFQHADGGWGWWKQGDSDPFMTAYVMWGFAVLRSSGDAVPAKALERAAGYLDGELVKYEDDPRMQAWMLHAIGAWRAASGAAANVHEKRAFDNAFAAREHLTAYGRALLALAAHDFGDASRAAVLARNLADGVKIDRTPDASVLVKGSGAGAAETMATAHWGEDRFWWRWYEGPVESTAFALQALVAVDPKNPLVEPAMNWLVKNRRGAQWNNTRDSAIAILALDDYLRTSGELAGDGSYELSVNGTTIASRRFTRSEALGVRTAFTIDPALVRDSNEIRIRRSGAPLYFAVEGRFVSLEEPVKPAANEIFVRRDYYRLAPRPTLLKGVVYDREPLRDGGSVDGNDRVEVVVTIETKNDYDYLMFEDLKPGGLEAIALRSGEPLFANELTAKNVAKKFATELRPGEQPAKVRPSGRGTSGRAQYVYQELRDRKVALFIDHLPQGVWELRYTLRAETPGSFHALPLIGQAMYVPEVRANGEEVRITVR